MDDYLSNFLQYIFDISEGQASVQQDHQDSIQCRRCGLRYGEFKKTGKLGCSHCYEAFRPQLADALKNIHGHTAHRGKVPKGLGEEFSQMLRQRELGRYKDDLERAIKTENYEEAARIRDAMRALESQ